MSASTFTSTASTATATSTGTDVPTSSPSPRGRPDTGIRFFNSSTILFGFVFLALIVTVVATGFVWHRYRRRRLGGAAAVGVGVGENGRGGSGGVEREKPILWDVYLGRQGEDDEVEVEGVKGKGNEHLGGGGGGLNERDGAWMGMKPLSIQLRSPSLDNPTVDSTRHPLPLWQEVIRGWLHPRTRSRTGPVATPAPPRRSGQSSFLPFRRRRAAQRPAAAPSSAPASTNSNDRHEPSSNTEALASNSRSPPIKTEIQVAFMIAMPSPWRPVSISTPGHRIHANSGLGTTPASYNSNSNATSLSPPNATTQPISHPRALQYNPALSSIPADASGELVYELGITVASVYADPRLCGFGSENG